MVNIAVLASTSGTDLQIIIDQIRQGQLTDIVLQCVISNKKNCQALTRTKEAGFEALFVDAQGKTREEYDREVATILDRKKVDLIIMIGYMRITSNWFVQKYQNRIMNIHPSLLPAFGGAMDLDVHQAVLDYGCKITGCTLHFITEKVDEGPIILQQAVEIASTDTRDTLKAKVQKAEQKVIIQGIKLYRDHNLQIQGNKVFIL